MGEELIHSSYLLSPVYTAKCKVDNEKTHTVHFIILTLKTLVKMIACKDKGKGL
jgi:hypothetical protein